MDSYTDTTHLITKTLILYIQKIDISQKKEVQALIDFIRSLNRPVDKRDSLNASLTMARGDDSHFEYRDISS